MEFLPFSCPHRKTFRTHIRYSSKKRRILPVRSYGHNYLDKTTFLQITLTDVARKNSPVEWYLDETLFSSSKLSVSLKSTMRNNVSELIPHTVSLPIVNDSESFTFQSFSIDDLCLEFEIYPTFGSKVIAKGVAPPKLLEATAATRINGHVCVVPLLDPRLQTIGQVSFEFTIIRPFSGVHLDINSQIDTYWKSTQTIAASKAEQKNQPHYLVTDSSLSGQYLWVPIQLTKDNVPYVCPTWRLPGLAVNLSLCQINSRELNALFPSDQTRQITKNELRDVNNLNQAQILIQTCYISLKDFLSSLSPEFNLHLQIISPTVTERGYLDIEYSCDVNTIIDKVLLTVFTHASELKNSCLGKSRSMFFSSSNSTLCTALNWKQPNCEYHLRGKQL